MTINVLNEFLPPAEDIRRGAIKVGETLDIDDNKLFTLLKYLVALAKSLIEI